MPRRPREHQIEAIARSHLSEAFAKVGWVVEDLRHDYGEDQLVRIFENGEATPLFLFVQSKATDDIEKFQIADGSLLSYSVSTAHLRSWNRLWEPVLITICDIRTGTTHWQSVGAIVEANPQVLETEQKSIRVHVPTENKLDIDGIGKIWTLTSLRFGRFEQEREGSQALLTILRDLGQDVEYHPDAGIIFIGDSEEDFRIGLFGSAAEAILRRAQGQGIDTDDKDEFMYWFFYEASTQNSNPYGSLEEFKQHVFGVREPDDPG